MFKVSARTVLELGSELISSDIIAFYELIKNGFDAGTKNGVEIRFDVVLRRNAYLTLINQLDKTGNSVGQLRELTQKSLDPKASKVLADQVNEILDSIKTISSFSSCLREIYLLNHIVVSDTGSGMSTDDLNKNFLVLGTPSRKREVDRALRSGSGKTPFLGEKGIGRLSAMRLGNHLRVETARSGDSKINLLDIDWAEFADLDAMIGDIKIEPKKGSAKPTSTWSGTRIIISDLSEDWTEQRVKRMVENEFARLTDPFLDQKQRPRIAVFWNDERLSIPWMDQKLISHAHAKVSGAIQRFNGSTIQRFNDPAKFAE